jgi:hypothetical protein
MPQSPPPDDARRGPDRPESGTEVGKRRGRTTENAPNQANLRGSCARGLMTGGARFVSVGERKARKTHADLLTPL